MNTQTLEQMKQLRLHGMIRAFNSSLSPQSTDYTNDELIAYLIQCEWDDRQNRKVERLTKTARFRYSAVMENIDYNHDRNIDRNQIQRFATCDFVTQKDNILITGSTGAGKSYMASAIGHQACSLGFKTMYFNTSKLFTMLKTSKADGSYLKQVSKIEKQDLLILDDFGLKGLDNINRHSLMEIIEDRHGKKSTIIASQLPVEAWHEIIGEQTIADAILDRLVHTAHRIDIKGESMRKNLKVNSKFNHNRIDFEHLVCYAHFHPAHVVHFDRLIQLEITDRNFIIKNGEKRYVKNETDLAKYEYLNRN